MAKIKCIEVEIYKDRFGDSSNGGVSRTNDTVLIPHKDGYITVDADNPPENLCRVVRRRLFGCEYVHVQPFGLGGTSMFGGCFVYSSDSRFADAVRNGGYPVALHDRVE